jgi:hypothetical protein
VSLSNRNNDSRALEVSQTAITHIVSPELNHKWVEHEKTVEIVPPAGATMMEGFWGGQVGRDPTAAELQEGIANALK